VETTKEKEEKTPQENSYKIKKWKPPRKRKRKPHRLQPEEWGLIHGRVD
jgi:hypothetical protein